nr:hypothetical protein GCM10025732_55530 [Glycomyces mayteni]
MLCNPGRHEADAVRLIPTALTLTVLALYGEDEHVHAGPVTAMRKFLIRAEDCSTDGAWKSSMNPSRRVDAATTALVVTALMCSGECERTKIAAALKFILGQQKPDGSWEDLEEDVLASEQHETPHRLEYSAHAIITRAICVGLAYVPSGLQRRCQAALFRLLRFLVSEQREDRAPKRDDRQKAISPAAIARRAQDMITIAVLCDLLYDGKNRYEAWRYQPWEGGSGTSVRQRGEGSPSGLRLRKAGFVVSLLGLGVKLAQFFGKL